MFSISDKIEDFKSLSRLYDNDKYYLNRSEQLPDNAKLLTVIKDGIPSARACLIYNEKLKYKGLKTLQIGFFEAENDWECTKYLFDEIKKLSQGFDWLIGPINGSTWNKYRVTLKSNNPPFLMDNYNKPYYSILFEKYGFSPISTYSSYEFDNLDSDYSRLKRFGDIISQKGIEIKCLDGFDTGIKAIYDVSVKSFINNFLYTPITFEEFYKMYKPVEKMINKEYVLIAYKDEQPLAFIFGYNDIFDKSALVLKTLALNPEANIKGLGSYLTELLHKKAYEKGFKRVIHALMKDDNISSNIMKKSAKILHKYNLYGLKL